MRLPHYSANQVGREMQHGKNYSNRTLTSRTLFVSHSYLLTQTIIDRSTLHLALSIKGIK